ncbi:DUF2206 domain-containing protein [Methanobacterium alcaliphilum]|uniref:DUF2206 domain-containing protein n=1 Tax=Methanobacterium alcaliphilum TaxID=392018 RepID=UPI002009E225|nr:DUF2206 domain-containing protein [Methanobacterium alcaliphilum]MCK9150776.1 DUF2206 domain-containing protein [Methanobacterium alcaliphilum]
MDFTWLFKIVYPFLFSFVPLTLYQTYNKITEEKVAFLGTFFLISFSAFYSVMISLAKQQIAEIFFVLILLLIVDETLESVSKKLLIVIFSICLIFSHYGLAYIFMLFLIISIITLLAKRIIKRSRLSEKLNLFNGTFILLFLVTIMAWYIYISSSFTFAKIVGIGNHITSNIGEILNPLNKNPDVLKILGQKETLSPIHDIAKYLYQVVNFFVIIGMLKLIFSKDSNKINTEYKIMAIVGFVVIILSIIVPFFSSKIGTNRIYHIIMLILSPFCIIGGCYLLSFITKSLNKLPKVNINLKKSDKLKIITILVLVPYFLFNVGFIYEITNDSAPSSISLSLKNMEKSINPSIKMQLNSEYIWKEEVYSAKWIYKYKDHKYKIYSDELSGRYILPSYGNFLGYHGFTNYTMHNPTLIKKGYIYLSRYNTLEKTIEIRDWSGDRIAMTLFFNTTQISPILKNKIYSSELSDIYFLG